MSWHKRPMPPEIIYKLSLKRLSHQVCVVCINNRWNFHVDSRQNDEFSCVGCRRRRKKCKYYEKSLDLCQPKQTFLRLLVCVVSRQEWGNVSGRLLTHGVICVWWRIWAFIVRLISVLVRDWTWSCVVERAQACTCVKLFSYLALPLPWEDGSGRF